MDSVSRVRRFTITVLKIAITNRDTQIDTRRFCETEISFSSFPHSCISERITDCKVKPEFLKNFSKMVPVSVPVVVWKPQR